MRRWETLFWEALDKSDLSEEQRQTQIGLFKEFRKRIEDMWERVERSFRLRDITAGLFRLEITFAGRKRVSGWWHPHIHVLLLSAFPIPQTLLSAMWTWACQKFFPLKTERDFLITDIRATLNKGDTRKVIGYIAKYMVKGEENEQRILPEDKEAMLYALLYTRKIEAWGLERSDKESVCPHCGKVDCSVVRVVLDKVETECNLFEMEERETTSWQKGELNGWIERRNGYWVWGMCERDPPKYKYVLHSFAKRKEI